MSLVPARAEMRRAARKLLGKGCNAFWFLSDDRSARYHGPLNCLRALSTGQFFPLTAGPSPLETNCTPDPARPIRKSPQKGFAGSSGGSAPGVLRAGFKGTWCRQHPHKLRVESKNATTPPQRNIFAGWRCANYWALKSPAWIGLRRRKKVQWTAMEIRPLINRMWLSSGRVLCSAEATRNMA